MKKRLAVFLSLAGIGCFIYILLRLDPALVLQHVQRISTEALLILLILRCIYWLIKTGCWWMILKGYNKNISFVTLFYANLSGNSIAYLTPPGRIGGEVMRFYRVGETDKKSLLASVMVDKILEWLGGSLLICFALILAFAQNSFPIGILVPAFCSILALTILLLRLCTSRKGTIFRVYATLCRILPRKFRQGRQLDKVREMESLVLRFHAQHPRRFFALLFLYILKGLFWTMEVWLTFIVLGAPGIGFFRSFLLVTVGSVSFLFPSLPGGVGVYEGTYISLFLLLRIPMKTGIGLVIIRRIIGLAWAGIGLFSIFFWRKKNG